MKHKFLKIHAESNKPIVSDIAESKELRNLVWRMIFEQGKPEKDKVIILTEDYVGIDNIPWQVNFKGYWEDDDNGGFYLDVYEAQLVFKIENFPFQMVAEIPFYWFEYTPQEQTIEQIYGI